MTNKQQVLNFLGLIQRAGKLITGEQLVLNEVRQHQAKLVIIASDASEGTKKKMQDKCLFYQIPINLELTASEISQAIGKERKILAVMDQGFGKRMRELLME